ncbi:hypothetical protein K402DRAFT_334899 [Aulographum hederae CBS 113979]|uniref:Uncharacterized protein n=1 Tax=Aulographum hederae CBS 113979 TaxID=1176131 RepID=A0A6G1GWG9_9PEZI|nr:hypothetical protein K402DRAFT_334899 [Aulographum hederae CBS 113979]
MPAPLLDSASATAIHSGIWTNWSHGAIRGATLTIPRRDGDLLTSLLVLIVFVSGTMLWRIAAFALAQFYSSVAPQDYLYHDRQAILRRTETSAHALYKLAKLNWTWRKGRACAILRILPAVLLCAISLTGPMLIAIFSPWFSITAGQEVLVSSLTCGAISSKTSNATYSTAAPGPHFNRWTASSANYAQNCYLNPTGLADCSSFVRQNLPDTIDTGASCPFEEDICLEPAKNIRIDTGLIDSHFDLGINARPRDRFQFRQVTTCAPLRAEGYFELQNKSTSSGSTLVGAYFYGPLAATSINGNETFPNASYECSAESIELLSWASRTAAGKDYSIDTLFAFVPNNGSETSDSDFEPIPALRKNDADVALVFISANGILFTEPTSDPVFSAHRPIDHALSEHLPGEIATGFLSDQPVGVIGCTLQTQYCHPSIRDGTGCGPLTGEKLAASEAAKSIPDPVHVDSLVWAADVIGRYASNPIMSLSRLGSSGLLARYGLARGVQERLPNDQWQREVQYWHSSMLASLQMSFVDVAMGRFDACSDASNDAYLGLRKQQVRVIFNSPLYNPNQNSTNLPLPRRRSTTLNTPPSPSSHSLLSSSSAAS